VHSLVIAKRFCGPPTTANGGYFSGMVAAQVPRPAFASQSREMQPLSVRLKAPPPLDTELGVVATPDGGVEVREGERLLGGCSPGTLDVNLPPPVPYEKAVEASRNYMGLTKHPFPTCFVCGTKRHPGDGLCIYAGIVAGSDMVASPWTPDASLDSGDGTVRPEYMWAALDCPGYAAVTPDERMMLLAQFTADLDQPVRIGERCVVVGWGIRTSGPKHEAGTALYGADGELRGRAWALWVEPRSTR
jgi:hypothetical protein